MKEKEDIQSAKGIKNRNNNNKKKKNWLLQRINKIESLGFGSKKSFVHLQTAGKTLRY